MHRSFLITTVNEWLILHWTQLYWKYQPNYTKRFWVLCWLLCKKILGYAQLQRHVCKRYTYKNNNFWVVRTLKHAMVCTCKCTLRPVIHTDRPCTAASNVTVRCPSVCLFKHGSTTENSLLQVCCWAQLAWDIDWLLYGQRLAAAVGECEQCHVVSVRRKLSTKFALAEKLTRQCEISWFLGPTRVYHSNCMSIGSSVFCRIPLLPSHRARVVSRISRCACHTMRSKNCLACFL